MIEYFTIKIIIENVVDQVHFDIFLVYDYIIQIYLHFAISLLNVGIPIIHEYLINHKLLCCVAHTCI